jgi:hypothetical protein
MKKVLIVLVGLMAVTAYAADMDIFFSTDNNIEFKTPGAIDLGDHPLAGDTATVYIYAQVDLYENAWNGFGLAFDSTGGAATYGELYNPNMGGDGAKIQKAFRWQNGSVAGSDPTNPILMDGDGDLAGASVSSTAFALLGIGADPSAGDYAGDPGAADTDTLSYSTYVGVGDWTGTFLVGEILITFDGTAGGLDGGVANDWITRGGDVSPWATIRFGGQDGDIDGRLTGGGLDGAYNDITWTPEPASMILLALGALVIRRR